MAVASVSTIPSASPVGWQHALERGFERARKTLRHLTALHGRKEMARVEDGAITGYLVTMPVTFVLEEDAR